MPVYTLLSLKLFLLLNPRIILKNGRAFSACLERKPRRAANRLVSFWTSWVFLSSRRSQRAWSSLNLPLHLSGSSWTQGTVPKLHQRCTLQGSILCCSSSTLWRFFTDHPCDPLHEPTWLSMLSIYSSTLCPICFLKKIELSSSKWFMHSLTQMALLGNNMCRCLWWAFSLLHSFWSFVSGYTMRTHSWNWEVLDPKIHHQLINSG